MTLLPFEEPHLTNTGFDAFWKMTLRKVGKGAAREAYRKAVIRAGESIIHEAWQQANDQWRQDGTELRFIPHPATWLGQDRWEDEGESLPAIDRLAQLRDIAATVRKPWYTRGRYPAKDLQACVDADLLTADEMEAAL